MGHDGNSTIREKADGFGHASATFQLDCTTLGFLDHARRIAKCLGRAFFIRTKRHINHNQGSFSTPHNSSTVHDHQV